MAITNPTLPDKAAGDGYSHTEYNTLKNAVKDNAAVQITDKQKLDGVATNATANATDAQLRDRSSHTGTQTADTITDGTVNKVLTAAEKTKIANLSNYFVGRFASLAALQSARPVGLDGEYATVDVAGQDAKQYIWDATDSKWALGSSSGAVASVNGQTGAVSLNSDNIPEGSTRLYFTVARVLASVLSGFVAATGNTAIVSTDSVVQAFQKVAGSISTIFTALASKADLVGGLIPTGQLPALSTTPEFKNSGTTNAPQLALDRAYIWQQADFIAAVQQIAGSTQGATPAGLIVDDTAKTLAWTMNSGETFSDFDFTQDANTTIVTATANPMTVSVLPNAINRVGVRRKAKNGLTASAWAYNQTAYTSASSGSLISGHTLIDPTSPASSNIAGREIVLTSTGVYSSTSQDQSDNPFLTKLSMASLNELAMDVTSRGIYVGIIETGQGINNDIVIGLGMNVSGGAEYITRDNGGLPFPVQPVAGDKIVMIARTGGRIFDFYNYHNGAYGSIVQTVDVGFSIAASGAPVKGTYDVAPTSHSNNMSGKGLTAIS